MIDPTPPASPATAATARRSGSASVSVALAGSGGSGVMTAGTLLLDAAARAGLYGLMVRSSGPQIRGGEAAALLRLARKPMDALDDSFDLLLAMDWQNVNRFADEIPLSAGSVVIGDADEGAAPEVFSRSGATLRRAAAEEDGQGHPGLLGQHAGARPGRRPGRAAAGGPRIGLACVVETCRGRAAGQPGRAAAGLRRGRCPPCDDRHGPAGRRRSRRRQALAHQRQRSGWLRRTARRCALRRRLPDHAGHRTARVDGAGADAGRRQRCCRPRTNSPRST